MRTNTTKTGFILVLVLLALIGPVCAYTYVSETMEAAHDGYVNMGNATGNLSWAALRGGAGTSVTNAPPSGDLISEIAANVTTGYYIFSDRIIVSYDTSILPDDAVIDSATLTIWGTAHANGLGSMEVAVVDASPASYTSYVAGDYDGTTFTRMATDITYALWDTDGMNDFALNTAGLNQISRTGYTAFMITNNATVDNSAPVWSSGAVSYEKGAPVSSTGSEPFLVVNYHTGTPLTSTATAGGGSNIIAALNMAGLLIVITGVGGILYSLMGIGGIGGTRGSYYGGGSSGVDNKILIGSILAIMIGSVLLILTYVVVNALVVASGI